MDIRAIGRYYQASPEGFLLNDCRPDDIPIIWKKATDFSIDIILDHFGSALHSIYLRGSVARALMIDGISDLDLIVLLSDSEHRWTDFSALLKPLEQHFPFIAGADLHGSAFHSDLDKRYPALAQQIVLHSVCLYGDKSTFTGLRFFPGKDLCFQYRWLSRDIEQFFRSEYTTKSCRDLCKTILRCGMELNLTCGGRYSPDLYCCAESFSALYPDYKDWIFDVLSLFLNPASTKKETEDRLNIGISFVSGEIKKRLIRAT